jgi:hypothetical protein
MLVLAVDQRYPCAVFRNAGEAECLTFKALQIIADKGSSSTWEEPVSGGSSDGST